MLQKRLYLYEYLTAIVLTRITYQQSLHIMQSELKSSGSVLEMPNVGKYLKLGAIFNSEAEANGKLCEIYSFGVAKYFELYASGISLLRFIQIFSFARHSF